MEIKWMMYSQPKVLHSLLEKIADTQAHYLNAQIEAGVQAVQLFDSWAGELNAADYAEFALPYEQRVFEQLHRDDVPVLLYLNGCANILEQMATSGADVLSIDGERAEISRSVLEKYNQPGPRYTSYPTAPEWDDAFGPEQLRVALQEAEAKPEPASVSLYFHLPFCEALCLFCGCNVVINKKHEVTIPYLANIKKEVNWVSEQINPKRKVEQLHWGGGTPTYLSADQIEELYSHIRDHFSFSQT